MGRPPKLWLSLRACNSSRAPIFGSKYDARGQMRRASCTAEEFRNKHARLHKNKLRSSQNYLTVLQAVCDLPPSLRCCKSSSSLISSDFSSPQCSPCSHFSFFSSSVFTCLDSLVSFGPLRAISSLTIVFRVLAKDFVHFQQLTCPVCC